MAILDNLLSVNWNILSLSQDERYILVSGTRFFFFIFNYTYVGKAELVNLLHGVEILFW